MSDDRPVMTPQPWPEYVQVTAAEMLPWFLEQSEQAQAWLLARWMNETRQIWSCDYYGHDEKIKQLQARVDKYREQIRWLTEHRGQEQAEDVA
jgi:hypothetical protein